MAPKSRIAIVCPGCGAGGSVGAVALRQARELAREFDVSLLSDSFPPAAIDGVAFVEVRSRKYPALRRLAHVPNELSFVRGARRALDGARSDFVIAHSHLLSVLAASPLGLPHALVTHGDIFDRPKGTFDPLLTRLYRWAEPRACRRADLVLAVSPAMAAAALRNGARPERVIVLPNGIDLSEFPPRPYDLRDDEPLRVLYLGRLSVEKGVDLLLEACALSRFQLDVVGGGPLEQRLREQAAPLGAAVTFHGARPRDEVRRFLARAAVVCVPSRSEPQGLVVLEALASGVPVIGSAVGGIPSMVRDGVNGLLVPPEPRAFADAIARLDARRGELRALAAAARPSVEPFAWEYVAARLIELVRTAVRETAAAGQRG